MNISSLSKFEKKYKVSSFVSLINLKKFFFKFTKFKRKSLSRIKHKTTWLVYSNIFSLWVKDYFFIKKYIKIQFFYNIFFYNIFFYNINFIKNNNINKLNNNFNFIYMFLNKKIFNYYNYNLNTFKGVNILNGFNRKNSFISNSVLPISYQFEKEIYITKEPIKDFLFFDEFILNLLLSKIKEFYKILIIINYYSIKI